VAPNAISPIASPIQARRTGLFFWRIGMFKVAKITIAAAMLCGIAFYFPQAHSADNPPIIHFVKNPDGYLTIPAADVPRFLKGLQIVFADNATFSDIIDQLVKKIESMKCV
jgi:hypothetical protein